MTETLSFPYLLRSTLPRRVFIVNYRANDEDERSFTVTAPDHIFAQELVRRELTRDPFVSSFWTHTIREVHFNYRREVVIRPFMLDGISVRFPYMQYASR